jgi:NAD(P)H-dependent flavin oxidoreductase YrpB (nitropropane dioxygenase family)
MQTQVCQMFGIDLPIFAFSHCRDVVVEVSRAGGMGVLGITGFTREQLEIELAWIDDHIGGKPYGVDILMPNKYAEVGTMKLDLDLLLPQSHRDFVRKICDDAGIAPLPPAESAQLLDAKLAQIQMTPAESEELVEVAFRHPGIKLMVNALGTPPRHLVERAHSFGIKVGSMVGKVEHVAAQKAAGVDLLIAQGMEAGGHTGSISSMVLWPQVVDAMAPAPVLAAGGIGRGRQMAAALALGASGVWCGSIWLGTTSSDVSPDVKQRLFAAGSEDAVQRRSFSGKSCRILKSKFTEAWEQPGAPVPLPMPLQTILIAESKLRIDRGNAKEYVTYPVGQIVGDMREECTVRQVVYDMLNEFVESAERMGKLVESE